MSSSAVRDAVNQLGLGAYYEQILYIILLKSKYDWPWVWVDLLPDIAKALTGMNSRITAKQIRSVYDMVQAPLGLSSVVSCAVCGQEKDRVGIKCTNANCSNVLDKASTSGQSSYALSFDVTAQLKRNVGKFGGEIVRNHALIHAGVATFREDDIRSKPGFLDVIEQQLVNPNPVVVLPACIHLDGTEFTARSKSVDWPISIGMFDLSPAVRFRVENLLFVGCVHSYKKPTTEEINAVIEKKRVELTALEHVGIQMVVDVGGVPTLFTFRLKICAIVADKEAIAIALNFAHSGHYCCPFCIRRGQHSHGSVRFATTSGPLRTPAMDRADASAVPPRNGHKGVVALQQFCTVCLMVLDPVHNTDEGYFPEIIVDLCGKGQGTIAHRRQQFRLPPRILDLAKKIAMTTRWPTYAPGRLRDFDETASKINAKECRALIFCQVPIALASSPLACELSEAWLLCVIFNHRLLLDRIVTQDVLDQVGATVTELAHIHNVLFGVDWPTVKLHMYFAHAKEQLEKYGNVHDIDTMSFEYLMGFLKREGSRHATNNYLGGAFVRAYVLAVATDELITSHGGTVFDPLLDLFIEGEQMKGARGGSRISSSIVIPSNASLPLATVAGNVYYQILLQNFPGITCTRRAMWHGQALSVLEFWRQPPTTEQNLVHVRMQMDSFCGRIKALGYINSELHLVLECFCVCDTFEALKQKLVLNNQAPARALLRMLNNPLLSSYLFKIASGPGQIIVCSETDIVSLGIEVCFDSDRFVVSVPLRCRYV